MYESNTYYWLIVKQTFFTVGRTYTLHMNNTPYKTVRICFYNTEGQEYAGWNTSITSSNFSFTAPSGYSYLGIVMSNSESVTAFDITITHDV